MSADHQHNDHQHGHCCGHHHHHHLDAALLLTAAFAIIEFVTGWLANSLALLADAVHMTSDVVALGLAAFAARLAARPAHRGMSFGYGRARVLAAQANGIALWLLAGWIVWEAIGRLLNPPAVQGGMVIVVALIGFALNLVVLKWLHGHDDLNTRAAYWHVLGDLLGSAAAVVAGIVIFTTGWMAIDPLLSLLVAAILAWGGWRLLNETLRELMEATPAGIDSEALERTLCAVDGVAGVHHIHVWKPAGDSLAISAHIDVADLAEWDKTLVLLQQTLHEEGIDHVTLQPESSNEACKQHCCEPCDHQ